MSMKSHKMKSHYIQQESYSQEVVQTDCNIVSGKHE